MENYLGVAKKKQITDEDIEDIQAIVMSVSESRIISQLREVQARLGNSN